MSPKNPSDKYLFSMISGHNFYVVDNSKENKISAHHYIEGTDVEIRVIRSNNTNPDFWREYIAYPPNTSVFLWPIDVVYTKTSVFSEMGNIGIVFKKKAFPKLEQLKTIIYNDSLLDWRKKEIQIITINLLESLYDLEKKGYAYISFDTERIYYYPDSKEFVFDFSPSTLKITSNNIEKTYPYLNNDISLDFLSPAIDTNDLTTASVKQEYYAVAALLFRLMIGRMPYQGSLLDGCGELMDYRRDTNHSQHIEMIKKYRSFPIFIFDEIDNSNSIGDFSSEEKYIERWEALNDEMKEMFKNVFSHNPQNKKSKKIYSTAQWINAISSCFH